MSDSDRIHPPTPQRRLQAREQGNVARSQELTSAIVLLCGVATLAYFGTALVSYLSTMLQNQLGGRAWLTLDAADVSPQFGAIGWGLATTLLPILVLVSVAAVLSQLAQSGFLLFPQRAVVDPQRINPAGGLGRLLSLDGTLRAFLGVVKLAAVAALTVWCALTNHQSVATAAAGDLNTLGGTLGNALLGTSLKIGGLMLAFGVADYAWNWWRHERSLRMTTQEIRDEQRALNGDPQVAAKRRATRYQLSESGQAQAIARVET